MRKPHKRLLAWVRSMDLVVKIYEITDKFPRQEIYGLVAQITQSRRISSFKYSLKELPVVRKYSFVTISQSG